MKNIKQRLGMAYGPNALLCGKAKDHIKMLEKRLILAEDLACRYSDIQLMTIKDRETFTIIAERCEQR
ncbi:MAG: hypothetical protein V3S69_02910 [Dehalococcoidales bacterium]